MTDASEAYWCSLAIRLERELRARGLSHVIEAAKAQAEREAEENHGY